jgi:hypothetical protein
VAGKKVSHHLNVTVIKTLNTHLDFDVTEKFLLPAIVPPNYGHATA